MYITKEYFKNQIEKLVSKTDFDNGMKEIKVDISELKNDVSILKSDMVEVKQDISYLKDDMRSVKLSLSDISKFFEDLSKRDKDDSDALAKIVVKHDLRLDVVEKDVRGLKLKLV